MRDTNERRFYTYEWFFVDTGKVFYVGKGHGRRYKERRDRNDKFKKYISKYECASRIVNQNLTEEESFQKEIEEIAKYKAVGWCECNFTPGGDAPPVHCGAEASYSKKVVQISKDGKYIKTWGCVIDAAKSLGISEGRISSCCKKKYGKVSHGGYLWVYASEYSPSKIYNYLPKTNAKRLTQFSTNGLFKIRTWDSAKEAEAQTGVRRSSICSCCKGTYKTAGGYVWRYETGVV